MEANVPEVHFGSGPSPVGGEVSVEERASLERREDQAARVDSHPRTPRCGREPIGDLDRDRNGPMSAVGLRRSDRWSVATLERQRLRHPNLRLLEIDVPDRQSREFTEPQTRCRCGPHEGLEPRMDRRRKPRHVVPVEQRALHGALLRGPADVCRVRWEQSVVDCRAEDRSKLSVDLRDRVRVQIRLHQSAVPGPHVSRLDGVQLGVAERRENVLDLGLVGLPSSRSELTLVEPLRRVVREA